MSFLDFWTPSYSGFTGELSAVTYGNGTFVAIGEKGTILTSGDGETWILRNSGTSVLLRGIAFGNGTFVAVGDNGALLTSTDAVNWTVSNGYGGLSLRDITCKYGTFVIVGDNGLILTSPDAVNWFYPNSGTLNNLNGVAHDFHFIAVGDNGTILHSSDGMGWMLQNAVTTDNLFAVTAGYRNTYVITGENGLVLTSDNLGYTWSVRNSVIPTSLYDVAFDGHGNFVAVAQNGAILSSFSGGFTWDGRKSGITHDLRGVAFGRDTFVVVGAAGTILHSDPETPLDQWYIRLPKATNTSLLGITSRGNTGVAVGTSGTILTSTDAGTNWNVSNSGVTENLNGVAHGNGTFIAVGDSGTIVTSKDGLDWSVINSGTTLDLHSVTFGKGTFVVVGNSGQILISTDGGVSWNPVPWIPLVELKGITYGRDLFVAVGDEGTILTSSDAVTWTPRTSGISFILYGVTFGQGLFVAVGAFGVILYSQDSVNWQVSTLIHTKLKSVSYGNGIFVTVGNEGPILTSFDGVNWTTRFTSAGLTGYFLSAVTFFNAGIVAVGGNEDNIFFESADLTESTLVVNQSVSPVPANVGKDITYTITITNNGPGVSMNTLLIDSLPQDVDVMAISTYLNVTNGLVLGKLRGLPVGKSVTISIVVIPKTEGEFCNTVTLTGVNFNKVTSSACTAVQNTLQTSHYEILADYFQNEVLQKTFTILNFKGCYDVECNILKTKSRVVGVKRLNPYGLTKITVEVKVFTEFKGISSKGVLNPKNVKNSFVFLRVFKLSVPRGTEILSEIVNPCCNHCWIDHDRVHCSFNLTHRIKFSKGFADGGGGKGVGG